MEYFVNGFMLGFVLSVVGGIIHYAITTKVAKRRIKNEYAYFFRGYEAPAALEKLPVMTTKLSNNSK